MPDLAFGKDNRSYFPTKYHGEVSVSKAKWDEVCQEPERFYYRENAEKIATALVNPEHVRHSKNYPNQFMYYKKFEMVRIGGKEVISRAPYWAIVIDVSTRKICTLYPTPRVKSGKEYTGESAK